MVTPVHRGTRSRSVGSQIAHRPGQVERRTHDYLRHGTTSFRRLRHQDRQSDWSLPPTAPGVEFRKFLDTIEAEVPADLTST